MTTDGISKTGIQSNLISRQLNESKQQKKVKPDKGEEISIETTDTVSLTAGIWEKELTEIDAIDEKNAKFIAQTVAKNLADQPFGMSTQDGTEAFRALL